MKSYPFLSLTFVTAILSSLSCTRNSNIVIEPDVDVVSTIVIEENANSQTTKAQLDGAHEPSSREWKLESHYKETGQINLFDGTTLNGWKSASEGAPKGWIVEDGLLRLIDPKDGEDIITDKSYGAFICSFEWRIGRNCNSGVKYKIERSNDKTWVGLEYQIQDDANVDDGRIDDRKIASLFDVLPAMKSSKTEAFPSPTTDNPSGNFRRGKIIVAGSHIEHWLDDERVLSFEIGSDEWNEAKKESKFRNQHNFGLIESSPILLQCHGYPIDFRNITLKMLIPIADE